MEEVQYQGQYIQVKHKVINDQIWEKAYLPNSLMVIAINEKNEILLIKEKRPHEKKTERLKFVTGHIDSGEDILECANRELQEEAGFKAKQLEKILTVDSSGTINSEFHCIIASRLTESKIPNPDGEDTILSLEWHHPLEVLEMYQNGKIPWSLSALGLYQFLCKFKYLLHG
jgi:ADP-ribose pyrophosphatase